MTLTERVGFYPGTFDPPTLGHLDIVRRSLTVVHRLIIGVATSSGKNPLLPLGARLDLVREALAEEGFDMTRISVVSFDGLLVEAVQKHAADVIVRGLRSNADFDYEAQLAEANRKLLPQIETVFILSGPETRLTASRIVREIARLGGDIRPFVSAGTAKAVSTFLEAL